MRRLDFWTVDAAVIALMVAWISGCGGGGAKSPPPPDFSVQISAATLAVAPGAKGQTVMLSATANSRDHFGNGNKFTTPAVADGRVFVGTPTGVAVFGLLR